MPIVAKFTADFEDFKGQTMAATSSLKGFEASAEKAGSSLRLVSSTSQTTAPHVNNLRTSLSQFDGVLSSVGIKLGPEIRALGELGDASGKTASQIGLLGTAGLALGAAVGGWKIGRLIADFFDLDEKIGNATAKLLGFGDVAAQEAGAGMDVLARASTLAGRAITDFAAAQQIIIASNANFQASMNTSEFRVSQWNAELAKVEADGKLEALRLALLSHNSTIKELSDQYGVSTRALDYFKRQSADMAAAQKQDAATLAAATEKMHGALERLSFLGDGWKTTLASIDPVTKTAIQNFLVLGATQSDLAIKFGLSALQIKAVAQGMAEQTQIMGLTEPALGSLAEWIKLNTKATTEWDLSLGFAEDALKAVIPTIDAVIPKVKALEMTYWEAIDAQARALGIEPVGLRPGETKNPDGSVNYPGAKGSGAGGARVAVGDTTNPERNMGFSAPGAMSAFQEYTHGPIAGFKNPFSSGGGSGVTVGAINVTQPLGTPDAIARAVSEALMAQLRSQGVRLPSGA